MFYRSDGDRVMVVHMMRSERLLLMSHIARASTPRDSYSDATDHSVDLIESGPERASSYPQYKSITTWSASAVVGADARASRAATDNSESAGTRNFLSVCA